MSFKLTIIGSGSAVPTQTRGVTAQYINFNERHFLIDCGEGTQLQLRKFKVKFSRLQAIFISHLHGDHYLGLVGLISSMSLLGRKKVMHIYGPIELKELLDFQFRIAGIKLQFEIQFHPLNPDADEIIFEDRILTVKAFRVKHRINCWGFRMDEKEKEKNVDPEKIAAFQLTLEEILKAKKGEDIVRETAYYRNEEVTLKSAPLQSYAFSADTTYFEEMANHVKGVSILYHEATFLDQHLDRAKKTMHSTAKQAATVAKNAEVGQLLLGHFSARYKNTSSILEEAKSIFQNSHCVRDGEEFLLP